MIPTLPEPIELIARALRDATYDDAVKDEAWAYCREAWREKAETLSEKLEAVGFQIVRKP